MLIYLVHSNRVEVLGNRRKGAFNAVLMNSIVILKNVKIHRRFPRSIVGYGKFDVNSAIACFVLEINAVQIELLTI